ncbi:MAG: SRPBCC domain-containing protein, partial [Bacteroidota bacterium]
VKIFLKSLSANETEVSFDGDARLSGFLARTGNRVVGSVANTLSKQFFEALQKEVDSMEA